VNQFLLVVAVALTVGLIVFGITVLVTGEDAGLRPVEPDGRSISLPGDRPLGEADVTQVRFDTAMRGYRMAQVDTALRRAAYDIGYKDELIRVLQAEVDALRDGRLPEAEVLRRAREAALAPAPAPAQADPAEPVEAGTEPEATSDAVDNEASR
jgi:DivIVA domain-containing protein